MVAMITNGLSPAAAVQYNEKKVAAGTAQPLLAANFGADMADLSFEMKVQFLEKRAALNPELRARCLHITLGFGDSEHPEPDMVTDLAISYMSMIGFRDQPYLVYDCTNSPDPHIRILTTAVDKNGKPLSIDDMARAGSRQVLEGAERYFYRKTEPPEGEGTEKPPYKYKIKPAIDDNLLDEPDVSFISLREALPPAMETILAKVLADYRFTGLEEFNAILRPFRLKATRGNPLSPTYIHHGLLYQALDEDGNVQKGYIKASKLPGSPTLSYLKQRFEQHRDEQEEAAERVRSAVDGLLVRMAGNGTVAEAGTEPPPVDGPASLLRFSKDLEKARIQTVWAHPKDSLVPAVVYIDHQARWAFREAIMGEPYSASALMKRWSLSVRDLGRSLDLLEEERRRTNNRYWDEDITPE